jgi:hypothetical protein
VSRLGLLVHVFCAALVVALLAIPLHARQQRVARAALDAPVSATVARLPSGDFALSGSGRHLRHVSLAEPAAAFADVVAGPDGDPAGGALAPPRDTFPEATP